MRSYLKFVRVAIIKKTEIASVGEHVKKKEPPCSFQGFKGTLDGATVENNMEVAKIIKNRTTIWFSNFIFAYLSKENENTNSKRYVVPCLLQCFLQ